MSILCDYEITERAGMIEPLVTHGKKPGTISYGLTSYGYDVRLAPELLLLDRSTEPPVGIESHHASIDPKDGETIRARLRSCPLLTDTRGEFFVLPPHSFALGRSVETLRIPRDLMVVCVGKSTYARCGVVVGVTPLEPEWRGTITLELSNTTPYNVRVYANEGITQLLFYRAAKPCVVSYADKNGKYQDQVDITLPKVV